MKKVLKKYFIPHEENNYQPHILSTRTVALVCAAALVAEAMFVFGTTHIRPNSKLFGIITVNALVDETNQSRTTNAVPSLQTNSLLQAAAQAKANDMATKGYFAHTSPTGVTPWFWFENAGYSFSYAGENLAVNFSDSQDVTNAWMNSPEHRENILNNNFTQIGIATAEGVYKGKPAMFVVELFGAPAATSPFAFVNSAAAASTPVASPVAAPSAKPASTPKTVAKTLPKPTPAPTPVPTVVLMNSTSVNAMSNQTFVAVKGAETQTVPVAGATNDASAIAPVTQAPVAQSNMAQRLLSDPKRLANDFYLFLMVLFAVAVILNVFIKIRVQYPKLIFSGLLVIVVAGLCVLLNQHVAMLNAAIL